MIFTFLKWDQLSHLYGWLLSDSYAVYGSAPVTAITKELPRLPCISEMSDEDRCKSKMDKSQPTTVENER